MERQNRAVAGADALMTRIAQAVMLLHGGDREEARGRFLGLWAEVGPDGDPLHRCTLAHYLADAQDDPADELAWDLRALSAAHELTREPTTGPAPGPATGPAPEAVPENAGERAGAPGSGPAVRAFYPSLHLNLAADYVKLGRPEAARSHLRRARGTAGVLADDGYSTTVRAAISRLERRLDG